MKFGSSAGLAGGSFPLVAALYVTECVEPNFRGAFGVFMNVMNVSGALFVNGVGSLVDWVALTGILIIFPGNLSKAVGYFAHSCYILINDDPTDFINTRIWNNYS